MVNEEDRNSSGGLRIQPWVWAIIVSLAIQILGAAYVTGRVTAQLDGVSYRVGRIEAQMDRYFGGVKP
jgi:hypothetical protein